MASQKQHDQRTNRIEFKIRMYYYIHILPYYRLVLSVNQVSLTRGCPWFRNKADWRAWEECQSELRLRCQQIPGQRADQGTAEKHEDGMPRQ